MCCVAIGAYALGCQMRHQAAHLRILRIQIEHERGEGHSQGGKGMVYIFKKVYGDAALSYRPVEASRPLAPSPKSGTQY